MLACVLLTLIAYAPHFRKTGKVVTSLRRLAPYIVILSGIVGAGGDAEGRAEAPRSRR